MLHRRNWKLVTSQSRAICRPSESGSDFWLCVRKSSYCGHSNQRLQVYRDMASKQICISRPSFLSFCGEYFRSCLCTASSRRVTRRCESKSSLSQRTKNGNTYLLLPVEKNHPSQKLILLAVLKKTAQAQSVSEGDRTNFLSLDICTSSDQEQQKIISKQSWKFKAETTKCSEKVHWILYLTFVSVKNSREFRRTAWSRECL